MNKPIPELYVAKDCTALCDFWSLVNGLSLTMALRLYRRAYHHDPSTRNYQRLTTIAQLAAREMATN